MASVRTEPGWVTRDVIWVSHNSPPFWKLCKVWGKVYRCTGHHDIVSMALLEGLHSRHKNGGSVHLFLWGTSTSPHRPLKTHYTGRVLFPGYAGGTNYRSKALLHVSVRYISSSEAEFSSHKMKWVIRVTQVFQRVDSLYPMVS